MERVQMIETIEEKDNYISRCLQSLANCRTERDFFRLQLQEIKRITEDTHKGTERAYTALSRINELAIEALRK